MHLSGKDKDKGEDEDKDKDKVGMGMRTNTRTSPTPSFVALLAATASAPRLPLVVEHTCFFATRRGTRGGTYEAGMGVHVVVVAVGVDHTRAPRQPAQPPPPHPACPPRRPPPRQRRPVPTP